MVTLIWFGKKSAAGIKQVSETESGWKADSVTSY